MGQRTGIEVRHKKACASRDGSRCTCQPTYDESPRIVTFTPVGRQIQQPIPLPSLPSFPIWRLGRFLMERRSYSADGAASRSSRSRARARAAETTLPLRSYS